MKVLSLGTDERVFGKGSAVRQRQLAYARALGQLDILVLARAPHAPEQDGALSLRAAAGNPFARLFRAYRILRRSEKPDVVTVQDPFEVGLVGYFAARHFGVPLHVQVHTDLLAPEYARHSFVNRIRVLLAGFILKRAARIRVVSERIKNEIEKNYHLQVPVTVLPIFVDVGKFSATRSDLVVEERFGKFATKLLVVARLEPEKNVELALRAFAQVAGNDSCLIVVGEGSARKRLQALSGALLVSDRVFFEGAQDPAPYYALADLVLVPSTYEGYGLVIVESLAAGKPVLSTDVGVAREAGAIVSSEKDFAKDLKQWFENSPRSGHLEHYPYTNFDEYVRAYCDDIKACTNAR